MHFSLLEKIALRQFRQEGCLSYLVVDRKTSEALLVDPHLELLETYRETLFELKLKLRAVVDTHVHADHSSASHLLRRELGCEIAMSALTRSERPTLRLDDGQTLMIGGFQLTAIQTTGHTPDSICLRGDGFVFTGDTLLVGATGRTDFPGASASQLHTSIHEKLLKFPLQTIVFPGHDYSQYVFSTIGIERDRNSDLSLSRDAFEARKKAELLETAAHGVNENVTYNLAANPPDAAAAESFAPTRCGRASTEGDPIAVIGVEKYASKLKERSADHVFIDVREREEYAEGHMEGARNIPLAELGLHLSDLKSGARFFFSCRSGARSLLAARTMDYLGIKNVINVTGGFKAWENAGLPVVR